MVKAILSKTMPKSWYERLFERPPVVAVLRLSGVLMSSGAPLRHAVNLHGLEDLLDEAFELKRAKAVALSVNCPGGAPVQAALLHDRIRALAAKHELKVFVFCEDVAASGGYWIACAGDEIYADANSIVGSIGVISAGFGFTEAIAKLGVERRVHTSGEKKSFLDSFRPENAADLERLERLQGEIHDQFKQHVRTRRGERLKGDDEALFSGEFWTGNGALQHGLIDGLGELREVMRGRFGENVKFRLIEERRGWLQRRFNIGDARWNLGNQMYDLLSSLEAKAIWSRYL